MKSLRTLFLSCLAAALLAIPCSAQAWIFQTYDTGTYTTVPGLVFPQVSMAGSGTTNTNTAYYYFRVLANDMSPLNQSISLTRTYELGGFGDVWGYSQRFFNAETGALINRSSVSNLAGTASSTKDILTNTLYGLQLTTTATSYGSGMAISAFTASLTVNTVDTSKTPIPGTLLLLGPGIAGLAALRKRFKG